ncbi:uncharacterized MFS-type transporter C09D4.1-like [Onthophagus taurus]|uniref:uncharacterized MFS-type transporter C09D4.1-like n=1 Tax=Onthophagus taurus TaxID=166361 RepID=UPI000C201D98|nr:uncharacterized MFS-type transporter C09D4.1-like [Onthophagus taurus]
MVTKPSSDDDCKTYKIRWLILGLFAIYSASNSLQWIQYSIIANIIVEFYGVSSAAVDWTSMIFMILYIPFVFPASMMLDKFGLRKIVIIGTIGTTIGAWVKVGSVREDLFWVTFLGQSIVALSQVCVLSVPARLAAVWFGPTQVSSACSIGVFGNQLGVAIGFLIPPWVVPDESIDEITTGLYTLFIGTAIFSSLITICVIFFFKDTPPTPPSMAEALKETESKTNFKEFKTSLIALALNRNFVLLLLSYGINVGIFYAISTLLNQIILRYYPDNGTDAGQIGVLIVFAGMLGSVLCGVVLDKTRKYKETTLAVYILSLIAMIIFTFTLEIGIIIVYITSALLGFFMTGLLPVGFELASELTYPEPEGTSAGLLNAAAQVFGIILTSSYSEIFYSLDDVWANGIMSMILVIGCVFVAFISSDLRRQAAHNKQTTDVQIPP